MQLHRNPHSRYKQRNMMRMLQSTLLSMWMQKGDGIEEKTKNNELWEYCEKYKKAWKFTNAIVLLLKSN
jgi:hypothetical protein